MPSNELGETQKMWGEGSRELRVTHVTSHKLHKVLGRHVQVELRSKPLDINLKM